MKNQTRKKRAVQEFAHGDIMTCANRYGLYAVHESYAHRPAARRLMNGQVHEAQTVDFLRSIAHKGDVLMAGVFVGDMLPAVSAVMPQDALIWGFEPVALSHRLATLTIRMNRLENVRLHQAALSDVDGELEMMTETDTGEKLGGLARVVGASYALPAGKSAGLVERVSAVRIDDVVPEDRDLRVIQLDLEGHEAKALAGATKTLDRCRPILIVEGNPSKVAQRLSALPPKLEYRPVGHLDANTILRSFA